MPFIKGHKIPHCEITDEYKKNLREAQKKYRLFGKKIKPKCIDCDKECKALRCKHCHAVMIGRKSLGRKFSDETKRKLRESHLGQVAWNKGRGKPSHLQPYPKEFNDALKMRIRARDKYTCQCCCITEEEHIIVFGYQLSVHHIDYNKANLLDKNLVTVCHACNARANHNKKYWMVYYLDIVPLYDGKPPKFDFENAKTVTESFKRYEDKIRRAL